MIEYFIPSGSSYAGDVDMLILLIAVLTGFWFFLTLGMFFYLIFKYREGNVEKAEYLTGKEKSIKKWVTIPHMIIIVCDLFIIVGAVYVWYTVKQNLPEADATVRVIGQQWAWTFVHPGADGELDTEDDIRTVDELHVEKGKTYHYKLESRDVLHSFSVPTFRLKQDAVPGREITGWFKPTLAGEFDIQCTEICGIGHGIMVAKIHVETPEEHSAWVEKMSPK
jgi:cytochrome c oxidase subunit 2